MKKFLPVLFFLVAFVGCGPRTVYPHLSWLVPWYVSDYISLDDSQKSMLQQRLLKQLDWHCRTQLPAYAEVLRTIGRDFANSDQALTYSMIKAYTIKLKELWNGLINQIGPDIADMLTTASEGQIGELFDNLATQNQELRKKYVELPSRQLNENRQKRMSKRLKYWVSNLTARQKEMVSEWSSQLEPISEDWLQNRELIQAKARRLLAQKSSRREFRAQLLELVANPDQMRTPTYQAKISANIDITINFIVRLDQLLSPSQRSHLLNRVESLASDFDQLSCDPKAVSKTEVK